MLICQIWVMGADWWKPTVEISTKLKHDFTGILIKKHNRSIQNSGFRIKSIEQVYSRRRCGENIGTIYLKNKLSLT